MNKDEYEPNAKIQKLEEISSFEQAVIVEEETANKVVGVGVSTDPVALDTPGEEEVDLESQSASSDISAISGFSDLSTHGWEPNSESLAWLHQQMSEGKHPLELLRELIPDIEEKMPIGGFDEGTLWRMLVSLLSEPDRRPRLRHISTIADVMNLIRTSSKILVLTGAGVSVSCGIPDFRSRNGVYARLSKDYPDLPDPTAMFDISYFRRNPRPFFQFAGELWPGQFKPSLCHRFIRHLEKTNKLLRNYTQNIDTLEQVAEIERVIQCHGSFSTATCMRCQHNVRCEEIEQDIKNKLIPICKKCHTVVDDTIRETIMGSFGPMHGSELPPPVLKPDIVFFGEGLPDTFHRAMEEDKEECDLLIVIGSSLKVRPVALIPTAIPPSVPQILINREPLNHMTFDVELLGDCDVIVNTLCHMLGEGWSDIGQEKQLEEITKLPQRPEPSRNKPSDEIITSPTTSQLSVTSITESVEVSSASQIISSSESRSVIEAAVEECSELVELQSDDEDDAFFNVAEILPEGTYFFERPGRYVFPGAEYFTSSEELENEESSESSEEETAQMAPREKKD